MTATARAGTVTSRLLFTASRLRPDAELADELERMDPGGSSLLALLARHARAAVGSDDRALGEVARLWEACGHAILAAEALAEAVRSAARDGRAGDAARWRQRLAVAMDLEGLVSTPGLRLIDSATPLTAREREIATRAADGLTSKQIAERLYVSPRTVDNHLHSVFAKLGVRARSELPSVL
jgi:DNA-binding NarL/FixJ family response regulator